jgi:hypothetical protein
MYHNQSMYEFTSQTMNIIIKAWLAWRYAPTLVCTDRKVAACTSVISVLPATIFGAFCRYKTQEITCCVTSNKRITREALFSRVAHLHIQLTLGILSRQRVGYTYEWRGSRQ